MFTFDQFPVRLFEGVLRKLSLWFATGALILASCGGQPAETRRQNSVGPKATAQNAEVQWAATLKRADTRTLLQKIANAVVVYASDAGYPATFEELVESKLVHTRLRLDPWQNRPFIIYPSKRDGHDFDVCSAGPDQTRGTEDDICNDSR